MQREYFQLGLIGWPLDHSLSPPIHTAAFHALGLAGGYRLFPCPPSSDGAPVRTVLERVRSGELHGLNVTIPYKQIVLPWLDELTPAAAAIGAVNTIYCKDGHLVGDNTDAPGFYTDVLRSAAGQKFRESPPAGPALVLGAGGSARAVVWSLVQAGWTVYVAARRSEQAISLCKRLGGIPLELSASTLADLPEVALVVNATPVGMAPRVAASPWPDGLLLPPAAAIYDLIYNPPETTLLRLARSQGLLAASGLGMLVEQAALAFQCWTGLLPPRAVLQAAAEEALRAKMMQPLTLPGDEP